MPCMTIEQAGHCIILRLHCLTVYSSLAQIPEASCPASAFASAPSLRIRLQVPFSTCCAALLQVSAVEQEVSCSNSNLQSHYDAVSQLVNNPDISDADRWVQNLLPYISKI